MKAAIKQVLRALAMMLVIPMFVSCWITGKLTSPDSSLESHSQWMSLVPGHVGNYLRNAFYRMTLQHCDPSATICFGVLISKTATRLGRNVYVGPRCMLGWVTLHDDALLGPGVQILSGSRAHEIKSLDSPIRDQPGTLRCVTVGADSWIGAAAIILADVGSQTVIGANSTVTKPIPSLTIAVGSPARPISKRDHASIAAS